MRSSVTRLPRRLLSQATSLTSTIEHRAWKRRSQDRLRRAVTDPREISKLKIERIVGPRPTIVEVGAHGGSDTEEFALLFPNGDIHAFEAHPRIYCQLHRRVHWYPNVTTYCCAVSNDYGLKEFNPSSGSSTMSGSLLEPSLHRQVYPEVAFQKSEAFLVPTVTLDNFLGVSRLDTINLLWIDVQGAELQVLAGASKSLASIQYIYTEASLTPLYENGASFSALEAFLRSHGFEVDTMFMPPDSPDGNVLFARG